MTAGAPCLSIVILTEDRHGHATIEALARRMFDLVVPGFGRDRVDFLPREPRDEEAMPGNAWKTDGKNPVEHQKKIRLLRYMARKLSEPDTFVLFHIDGDRPWSERDTSENTAKFAQLVQISLPQVVDVARVNVSRGRQRAQTNTAPPPLHRASPARGCVLCRGRPPSPAQAARRAVPAGLPMPGAPLHGPRGAHGGALLRTRGWS